MDWDEYKRICDAPRTFTRWALDHSVSVARGKVLFQMKALLQQIPLDRPADHKGGPETDVFQVNLDREAAQDILEALAVAEGDHAHDEKHRRIYRILQTSWREYLDVLDDQ